MGDVPSRRHDLDLLRASAMVLGIALHAAVATLALPGVSAEDRWPGSPRASTASGCRCSSCSADLHRTLWKRHGPRGLLRDRSRRVALPLLVSLVTIIPMLLICGYIGSLAPVDVANTGIFEPSPDLVLGVGLGHLWYLFLLVLAYVPLARTIARSAAVLVWVLPVLAVVPQLFMVDRTFGPDFVTTLRTCPAGLS